MNRRNFMLTASALGLVAVAGPLVWKSRWKYIVVHHSAGDYGTIPFLQRVHRERQPRDPIDAIPYHYVVGNGNGLKAGEIASDWRGRLNVWGAHVSGNNRRHNFLGIGICLIGNFEEKEMPREQFRSLVALTRELMLRYDIPPGNVVGHGLLEGESTKCPGKKFPHEEFEQAISVALVT